MSASIRISACDNEMYIIASTGAGSSEICHISSGFNNPVAYAVDLASILPKGTYDLTMVGINWGAAAKFAVTVTKDGVATPYSFEERNAPAGVVWKQTVQVTV
jgi:hypothetical protein